MDITPEDLRTTTVGCCRTEDKEVLVALLRRALETETDPNERTRLTTQLREEGAMPICELNLNGPGEQRQRAANQLVLS